MLKQIECGADLDSELAIVLSGDAIDASWDIQLESDLNWDAVKYLLWKKLFVNKSINISKDLK